MDPAVGAKVEHGPARVTLTFNEGLQQSFAVLNVVGPDGHYWQQGEPVVRAPRSASPSANSVRSAPTR
ncbi:Copper resistance protein CopC [Gordonia bronchialis]|nr:Copper resistance protein CopC [Gordonia bronchialis]